MAFEKRAAAWKDVVASLRDLVILVAIAFALVWPSQVRELFTKAGIRSFFGLVVEKTTNELRDLQEANKVLAKELEQAKALIEKIMAGSASWAPGANADARKFVESAKKRLAAVQEAQKAAEQQIKRNERIIRQQSMAQSDSGQTGRRYAIIFSGDRNLNGAIREIRRATGIRNGDLSLYYRKGVYRGAAEFESYRIANENLATYRNTWKGAYIVTLNSWCPTTKRPSLSVPRLLKKVSVYECV